MPSFLCTYSSVSIPIVPRASQPPVLASSTPSFFNSSLVPSTSSPTWAPSVGKVFVVGPGYVPIPEKLAAKITSGAFIDLADLLAKNRPSPIPVWMVNYLLPLPNIQGGRDHRHSHMDSGLYHLPVDLLQYLSFSLADYYSVSATDPPDGLSDSWTSLVELRHSIQEGCCSLSSSRLV